LENLPDIYFKSDYGKLNEHIENGIAKVFELNSEYGSIRHQFIVREIPIKIANKTYYDLTTPYGYGGPIITESVPDKEDQLINKFENEFSAYCLSNNIVSEFVRFHPVINNADSFKDIYKPTFIRKTLGTNLKNYDDPFQEEFSRSSRKKVRQTLKKGITYEVIENPKDLDDFKKIYYSTMDRNKADEFYYFDEEYFNKSLELFPNNIIVVKANYEGKTVAQGFYFVYGKYIHIHLSGTLTDYIKLSPAYILRYAVTLWGKDRGYELIHHGGGRTNSTEDTLYRFKKRFAQNTEYNFKIGKKIWNHGIYKKLCGNNERKLNTDFFPAYRAPK